MKRLAVIGGGAWGSALAQTAARAGAGVVLWARDPAVVEAINRDHANPVYLPGIALDPAVAATAEPETALAGADGALIVVPAQFLRSVVIRLAPLLPPRLKLLLCAKGIETNSLKTMSEIAAELTPASPACGIVGSELRGRGSARSADGGDDREPRSRYRRQLGRGAWHDAFPALFVG